MKSVPGSGTEGASWRLWRPDVPFAPRRCPFFYGWVIVAIGTLGVIASIPAQTMGIGVFTEVLIDVLGVSRLELSLAYMIGTLASGFLLPSTSGLLDVYGARAGMVVSTVLLGLSLLLLSAADWVSEGLDALLGAAGASWVSLLVVSVSFFLVRYWGQGILTIASRNVVGKWFNRRRGVAIGITGVTTGLVFSLSPTILNTMVLTIGWRSAWLVLAAVLIGGFAVVFWLLVRDNPEECGLEMDGGEIAGQKPSTNLDMVIHREYTRADAVRTFSFWCFSLTLAWHGLFMTAYAFNVVDIGTTLNIEAERMFALFFYAALISVCVNLGVGAISERIRMKWLLVVENAVMVLMPLALALAPAHLCQVLIVIAMGIGGGLWSNISGVVYPRFFGRRHLGAISGLAMSLTVVTSAVGPIILGASREWNGNYNAGFYISACVAGMLLLGACWADNPQRKIVVGSDSLVDSDPRA